MRAARLAGRSPWSIRGPTAEPARIAVAGSKKVLVGAADLVDRVRRLHGHGVAGGTRIDWPELMRFKHRSPIQDTGNREKGFRDAGIATLHGRARFTGPTTLEVSGERLEASRYLIAAGAAPGRAAHSRRTPPHR